MQSDTIKKTMIDLKIKFGGEELKKFVKNKCPIIVGFPELKLVLRKELKGHYLKQLKDHA